MDSQFKQRLTGAVILVLLAVLLVPELLTGPKSRPSGPTSSATAPAAGEGAPLRSYDIDLSEAPQAATAAGRCRAEPAGATPPSQRHGRKPRPSAARRGAARRAAAADEAPSAAPAHGPAAATAPAACRRAAEPADTPPAGRDARIRRAGRQLRVTRVAPIGWPRTSAVADSTRSSRRCAVPARQLYRVRVGPVADRAAAQALAARLKAAGQQGSVVSLP